MNHRETMARLNAALHKIDSAYEAIAKKHGLTFNALMIMYVLGRSQDITQTQIRDELHLPKSTIHSILSDFIQQDYVHLTEGSNKKEKFITATARGRRYFSKVLEDTEAVEQKVLDALGQEACTFLTDTAETAADLLTQEIATLHDGEAPCP